MKVKRILPGLVKYCPRLAGLQTKILSPVHVDRVPKIYTTNSIKDNVGVDVILKDI